MVGGFMPITMKVGVHENLHQTLHDWKKFEKQEAAFCGFYPREVPGFLAEILNLEGGGATCGYVQALFLRVR
jgi:hypothetical protein